MHAILGVAAGHGLHLARLGGETLDLGIAPLRRFGGGEHHLVLAILSGQCLDRHPRPRDPVARGRGLDRRISL
jgi:hypothetical protein